MALWPIFVTIGSRLPSRRGIDFGVERSVASCERPDEPPEELVAFSASARRFAGPPMMTSAWHVSKSAGANRYETPARKSRHMHMQCEQKIAECLKTAGDSTCLEVLQGYASSSGVSDDLKSHASGKKESVIVPKTKHETYGMMQAATSPKQGSV